MDVYLIKFYLGRRQIAERNLLIVPRKDEKICLEVENEGKINRRFFEIGEICYIFPVDETKYEIACIVCPYKSDPFRE